MYVVEDFLLELKLYVIEKTREVGIEEARVIKYRLREHMIIISLDGPNHNVIKFKSPMCFSMEDVDYFCDKLETIIKEMAKE